MELFTMFWEYRSYFLTGVQYTLILAAIGVLCGFVLGLIIALLRMSSWKIVRFFGHAWVEFLRGTPMLVQLLIIHYGFATVLGVSFSPIESGAITLTINSSAYLAEIFRAGIEGVDRGQGEAARSLGMSKGMTLRFIIIPQALKSVLPAIGNEFITIIKESSIVSMIGVTEIIFQSGVIVGITYDPMTPYLIAAIMYFILTFTLSRILGVFERKLKASDHR
ncbi:polar amino acid transport system substrate-binding protein [Fontibacillus panacisegetis]|uniref:Polar amino acid transport system substrate-binding protein n=1 Tax=Fontibacillus panacisegetis TaxID=670482 RepID=A0A1G7GHY0_9BACL|nr:amino acid ABC transporter permease [Fontibacillus panacisegetis]SDE87685.1 polar amino acid transport system substrate-binding protein [Fontibacillus panacisegetis]